ncbi:TcaA NTF2-like domain-containing protein [Streptococcus sp. DD13]|uniref:TcaA NTF2-like domain-containing protein n=1 Tax=Streptococcus sp. DD13 TaxID=1777881 RepID=UPI000798B411|nr:hypothetical protein [Streptococcus sp. DD13]KXT78745.1 hypothetical protein STRDD13_00477 [Streptococcus sp. DD13]
MTDFLQDYRDAVFEGVKNRTANYSKYYDNDSLFEEMKKWTTQEVKDKYIDYYTPIELTVQEISEDGDTITVKTHEEFRVTYTKSSIKENVNKRDKVYTLKKTGNSFVITNLVTN